MTKGKSTTKATARQEPRNIPTKPGFYWVKLGCWQPCEVRDLGATGLRVWFLGVPQAYALEELALPGRKVEWGPEIKPPPSAPPDMKKYYTPVMITDEDHERLGRLADATGEPMYRVMSRALDLLESKERVRQVGEV